MRLSEMQAEFKVRLLTHSQASDGGQAQNFVSEIDEGDIGFDARFSVYADNLVNGLTNILKDVYPLVTKIVGDEFMAHMARSYIKGHLPQSGNMNEYGADFPDFITGFEAVASLAYLSDVARFEWFKNEAYHAPDDAPLDVASLMALSEEQQEEIVFTLRSSCRLLKTAWPVTEIAKFCEDADGDSVADFDMDKGGVYLMIYRPVHDVEIIELNEASFTFMRYIEAGKSLADIFETFPDAFPHFDLAGFLQSHYGLQSFSGFKIRA